MKNTIRPLLRGLSTVLIVAGLLLLADAAITLLWQEPVSAFMAQQDQNRLSGDLHKIEGTAPTTIQPTTISNGWPVVRRPSKRNISTLLRWSYP